MLLGGGFDPWGLSRYAYVEGNPLVRTDPTGHNWWSSVTSTVSAVAQVALPVAGQVLDTTTGIPSMVHDLQTLTDSHASTADKLTAGADFLVSAVSTPSTASSAQTEPAHAETIQATSNHPWLTADSGWVPADGYHDAGATSRT